MLRKAWHLLGLVFPAAYYFDLLSRRWILIILGAIVIVVAAVETARFLIPAVNQAFIRIFRPIIRVEEHKSLNSTLIYLPAVFISILFFPKDIACAAAAFLGLGDTAAELVGRNWKTGRVILPNNKSLQGTLACAIICFGIGILLVPWPIALAGALAATVAELFSPGKWDNGLIPISAAGVMWLAARILNITV